MKLIVIMCIHVDDFCDEGNEEFCNEIMEKLRKIINCGKEGRNSNM